MARRTLTSLAVIALFCIATLAGCSKPTQESVAEEAVGKMNEAATALKGVKDESSAKAAGEKLKSIAADMKKLKEQMDKLPKPTPEQEKKLEEKHGKEMATAMQAIMTEGMRLASEPKLMAPIQEGMEEITKQMK